MGRLATSAQPLLGERSVLAKLSSEELGDQTVEESEK